MAEKSIFSSFIDAIEKLQIYKAHSNSKKEAK